LLLLRVMVAAAKLIWATTIDKRQSQSEDLRLVPEFSNNWRVVWCVRGGALSLLSPLSNNQQFTKSCKNWGVF